MRFDALCNRPQLSLACLIGNEGIAGVNRPPVLFSLDNIQPTLQRLQRKTERVFLSKRS